MSVKTTVLQMKYSWIAMFSHTMVFLFIGLCHCQSLKELHTAMKEKHFEVVQTEIAKVINESIPFATDSPKPALAEYETFRQSKKVNYIITPDGKLVFRQYRRLSVAGAMNRIKGIVDPKPNLII